MVAAKTTMLPTIIIWDVWVGSGGDGGTIDVILDDDDGLMRSLRAVLLLRYILVLYIDEVAINYTGLY